jgi:enterochelin esterase-like enzyme
MRVLLDTHALKTRARPSTTAPEGYAMTKRDWTPRWIWGVLLLAALPACSGGRPDATAAWVTDTIDSRALGRRAIYVATPDGYEHDDARYPILVLLDASDQPMFQLWLAQSAYLAENRPGVPRMIAVGIPNGDDRLHDMTPPATGTSAQTFKTAGGAAAFADFIIDEVLPYIHARYRTCPSVIVAGHSVAGLFAIDVAARRPGVLLRHCSSMMLSSLISMLIA